MPSQAETLSALAGDVLPPVDLPDLPLVDLPEKLRRAFPELDDWQKEQRAALDTWRADANYRLRRG